MYTQIYIYIQVFLEKLLSMQSNQTRRRSKRMVSRVIQNDNTDSMMAVEETVHKGQTKFIHINKTEAECLIRLFSTLVGEQTERNEVQGLDRGKFRNILLRKFGLTNNMIMDRVFHAFDKDKDGYVSVKEWIEGLAVFLRGTLDEKIKFCFCVYDLTGSGHITREEMFQFLKDSLKRLPEGERYEGVKDLVEIALKKMDYDRDGRISYSDFEKAVRDENLLLQVFGSCLPDATRQQAFEQEAFPDTPRP